MLEALLRRHAATSPATFDDPEVYRTLADERRAGSTRDADLTFNRVFYLSTAPEFFPVIVEALGAQRLWTSARAPTSAS